MSDYTNDSGEGRWTVEEAIALSVPMPVITASLFARFASRQQSSPTMQAVAALRGQFGGHEVMTIAEGDKLRAGGVPATAKRAARKESPTKQATKRAVVKKASAGAQARASKANVGAAKKAVATGRANATKATDTVDSARGQKRAAKKTTKS